jgi:tRNA pseudouridine38-40 synthase
MASGSGTKTKRIALLVQYDGTSYSGWQYQNNAKNIQSEIEGALEVLLKTPHRIIASGRTDAGVHALGQVAHFDTASDLSLDRLCISLNGILPRDIAIANAFEVPDSFHARYSAVEREYRYLIHNHPQRSPFMLYRAMWVREHLDDDYLRSTLNCLVGERDFASFCKKISVAGGTVRRITGISVARRGPTVEILIRGNAFLHNMIRIIVGTVLELYFSGSEPEEIERILENRDRDCSGATAPPFGLYLNKIRFDPPLETMKSAFRQPVDASSQS